MIAIPAIDLREGACVQLVGGRYEDERVRIADPLEALARWKHAGFRRVHLVDLDAATGRGDNREEIERLLSDASVRFQVGGGVRSGERIAELLSLGADAVVVGTRAVEDLAWLAEMAERFPRRLVVAADVRGRELSTRGWAQLVGRDVAEWLSTLPKIPLAGVLVTAVHQEGRLQGPDVELVRELAPLCPVPLIASGGIGQYEDLARLEEAGAAAAVIGMALYQGALDPARTAREFSA